MRNHRSSARVELYSPWTTAFSLSRSVLLIQAILIFASFANSWSATYYVAKSGNDMNSGTEAQPWLTIQKAADTLVAGDTVYIKAGTYQEMVTAEHSGAPGQYITFAAYGNDVVVLDGENLRPEGDPRWGGLFQIGSFRSYIRVRGLRAINSRYAGFLTEDSDHIVFELNSTSGTWSSGISAWNCFNIIIDGNNVRRACLGSGLPADDATQECISVSNTDTFEIRYNEVYDRLAETSNGGEGITAKDADLNGKIYGNLVYDLVRTGIYVDAQQRLEDGIEVFGNIVHHTEQGISVTAELTSGTVRNVRVYNNLVYDNGIHGIVITDNNNGLAGGGDGAKQNVTVINNTVVHNGYQIPGWGGGIGVFTKNPNSSNLVVRNNICSQNAAWQIVRSNVTATSLTVEYNLLDGPNDYDDGGDATTSGTNVVTGSPRFVDAVSHGYRLQANSPAIDRGSATSAPLTDYAGISRPQDGNGDGSAQVDIGAYEYQLPVTRIKSWNLY